VRKWPLDNPEKLLEKILSANFRGVKPNLSKLEAIVDEKRASRAHHTRTKPKTRPAPAQAVEEPVSEDSTPPPPEPAAQQDVSTLEKGVQAELKRMQDECAKAYLSYTRASRPLDKLALHKVWVELVKSMRELAKAAPDAEREARTVVPVADVEEVWTRAFQEARAALENLPRRIATNKIFAPHPGLDPVDVEAVIRAECDGVVAFLEKGSWLRK
jgi:hypothetical protein